MSVSSDLPIRISEYRYLYHRVEYPHEGGYRMEAYPMPEWIHIKVTEYVDGSKDLTVCSRLHLNKQVKVGPTYGKGFYDADIIKELSPKIRSMFIA